MSLRSASAPPARLFVASRAWIAFFSARDGQHAEADRLIRDAFRLKIPLITTNLVLAEVHRLLVHRAGIKPAAAALERIDASRGVVIKFADAAVHREARDWLNRLDDRLSYTDAASFAVMKANRCAHAIAFGRDFVLAGYSLWTGAS